MSDPVWTVEIDRVTLTGLEVTPDRAEHLRTQVEAELRHRWRREVPPRSLAGGRVNHLRSPEVNLSEPHSDSSVASALARSISRALREVGSSGRG